MKKYYFIIFFIIFVFTLVQAADYPEILNALKYAYNFQFEKAEDILNSFKAENPDVIEGDIGTIIYDFLLINQNPNDENFDRIYDHLDVAEHRIEEFLESHNNDKYRFYDCFIDYYYMKSYALDDKWIRTSVYAGRAREKALELKDSIRDLPDLYFILGDQDYSASLVPDYLKPIMKAMDFTPDRYQGLALIDQATEIGYLTRYEASIYYISSSIYVERDYEEALKRSISFLGEFPDNLSVQFYLIDMLLHLGDHEAAAARLDMMEKNIQAGVVNGKWVPRFIQMRGNLYNSKGDYNQAVKLYGEALEYKEMSAYTVTEIALEAGKLYDIIGDRKLAEKAYKVSSKSKGLELQREEARTLRKTAYSDDRGSY